MRWSNDAYALHLIITKLSCKYKQEAKKSCMGEHNTIVSGDVKGRLSRRSTGTGL